MAEHCAACPWSRPLPPYMAELQRLHNLLRLGVTIPHGTLGRWTEDALLVLDDEFARRTARPPTPG